MQSYENHFLLNSESVKDYVKNKVKFFKEEEELEAFEIGDGNINYVFKVVSKDSNRSLVVKQADKFLRSSGRPLDVYRNKIECEILKIEGTLAKGYVPQIYYYDDVMCALSMEDISAYKNLRKELAEEHIYEGFSEHISNFLADTLLPTTDLVMNRAEKKESVKKFCNVELCDISEDLVLCEPYFNYKDRNIITEGQEDFVNKHLYENEKLKANVLQLRNNFMNNAQALIHGDLHTGSIFINESGIKVIDPEFAFYGPMGYDIGNVIGNMMFSLTNKSYTSKNNAEFLSWIKKEVEKVIDLTMEKITLKYDELVSSGFYQNAIFKQSYLSEILSDSLGYAGTEMIRRVVGDSKVSEVTNITTLENRIKVERALIKLGIYLITNRMNIKCGSEVIQQFELIIA